MKRTFILSSVLALTAAVVFSSCGHSRVWANKDKRNDGPPPVSRQRPHPAPHTITSWPGQPLSLPLTRVSRWHGMPMETIFIADNRECSIGKDLTTAFISIRIRWIVRGTANLKSGSGKGIAGIAGIEEDE